MGTTSDKLTYLNGTKQALKDSINNIGGSITDETTFRAYATELDNIYSNIPKTTGEGSNLSLTTLKGRINVDDILGDTQQDTTTGKNYFMPTLKINNTNIVQQRCSVTLSGDEFTFVATGTDIYFGNVVAQGNNYNEASGVLIEIPTGVAKTTITTTNTAFDGLYYTFYDENKTSLGYGRAYATGTNIVENAKYLGVRIGVATATSGTTYKTKVMVTFGNVDNTYEPYTNGASPNPTYPQTINVVTGQQEVLVRGKNLFDGILESGIINGNTGLDNPNSNYIRAKDYIAVEELSNYKFSCDNSNVSAVLVYEYKADKSYNMVTNKSVGLTSYLTTEKDTAYIRFRPNYQTTDTTIKFMVEKGTTASAWQPYQEQTKIVNLSSKNLIGLSNGTYSNNGITAVVENGTITLNGTASGTSFVAIPLVQEITLSNSAITLSTNNEATGGDNLTEIRVYTSGSSYLACSYNTINNSVTYTNKADTYLRLQIRTSSGISYSDFILKPQLEYNSSATTYEPYYNYELGGIGTYKNRIFETSGKNKFSGFVKGKGISASTGAETTNANAGVSDYIPVNFDLNSNYYISGLTNTLNSLVGAYNSNKEFLGRTGATTTTTWNLTKNSFTNATQGTGDIAYIRVEQYYLSGNTGTIDDIDKVNIMLNEGSTALPYEPYGSDKWYIEKNIYKIANKTNWVANNMASNNRSVFTLGTNNLPNAINIYGSINCISNTFIAMAQGTQGTTTDINNICINGNNIYIKFADTINTKELAKAQLDSMTNFVAYYVLANTTYEEITNTNLINELNELEKIMSYNGTTNINISGNLPMLLSVSALKGESE